MPTRVKVVFTVPENLQKELRERVIRDGYGLRGKSTWVSEAIQKLLLINNFPELVSYNDEMHNFRRSETVVVDLPLKLMLSEAIVRIRKDFPALEGVQSRIIRTAILQRFLRS